MIGNHPAHNKALVRTQTPLRSVCAAQLGRWASHIMRIRTLIFLVLLSLLTACATPYKPYGSLGGYLDKEISPGTYIVEYHGNGYTTHEKIEVFLHQRAGELCGSRYEIGPIDRTSKLERNPNAIWIVHRFPVVSAEVKCKA